MTASTTPIRECDAALDYLYDMLAGEEKARFESHLTACERCQQELASFGKVRVVARATLPPVEPSERLTGPLHAQLMHAAAQRPRRGQVLPFLRRVLNHPGYAAAAGVLIIGGAIGVQWSRGRLLMPAPEASAPVTAAPPAPPTTTAAAPGAAAPSAPALDPQAQGEVAVLPAPAEEKLDDKKRAPTVARAVAPTKEAPASGRAREQAKAELQEDAADRAVTARFKKDSAPRRDYDGKEADGVGGLGFGDSGSRAAPPKPQSSASAGPGLAQPAAEPTPKAKTATTPPQRQAAAPPAASTPSPVATPSKRPAPMDAPPPPPEPGKGGRADDLDRRYAERSTMAADEAQAARGYKNAPPAGNADDYTGEGNALGAKSSAIESESRREARPDAPARGGSSDGIDAERSRAGALAQKGRCEEASHVYEALERKVPDRLSATDRLTYARCLRELGRLDPAQRALDQLRAGKQGALPAAALGAEQKALDERRKRQAAADAASTGEQQQAPLNRRGVRSNKKAVRSSDLESPAPSAPASSDVKRAY